MAKLGSMTKQMPKATGTRGQLRGDVPKGQRVGGSSAVPPTATYADLGLDKKTISKAQQLADLPAHAMARSCRRLVARPLATRARPQLYKIADAHYTLDGEGGRCQLEITQVRRNHSGELCGTVDVRTTLAGAMTLDGDGTIARFEGVSLSSPHRRQLALAVEHRELAQVRERYHSLLNERREAWMAEHGHQVTVSEYLFAGEAAGDLLVRPAAGVSS